MMKVFLKTRDHLGYRLLLLSWDTPYRLIIYQNGGMRPCGSPKEVPPVRRMLVNMVSFLESRLWLEVVTFMP